MEANSSEKHFIKTDFKTDNLKQKSFRLSKLKFLQKMRFLILINVAVGIELKHVKEM